ncbi:hypothetical protein Glove_189g18 [Diversispora epigaea]|uniref:Exportin-T n=1 Tax=Diversispora epigaea TaxID=1348612 RepID=A0A397ISS5_9GLOM|nr:hypothetical protein Glove_189g18 [Diversispora epigaea]
MEEQIEQAVTFALSPTADHSLKSQAMNFCEQVKVSPEGWLLCLSLFVRFPKSTPESRLFALQVVEEVLKNRFSSLDASQVHQIQSTLMDFVKREYVLGGDESEFSTEPQYLKNKFAHTLTLLFVQLYPSSWINFFDEFLALIQTNNINGNKTNMRTIDIFLRVLLAIDEEVASLVVPREKDEVQRNSNIKDYMRGGDVQKLALIWYQILEEYITRNQDIAEMCLKLIGLYISWIDISLIVNDTFITRIYPLLGDTRLRIAACECLSEIVYKGMKPHDKFKLIQALNLTNVMTGLDYSDDIEFVEQVAKLTNVLGVELCKIWEEMDPTTKSIVYIQIELLLQFLLKFLADEYDDTSCAVFSFLSAFLSVLKKQIKQVGELSSSQREFLDSLLKVIVIKMKFDDESDWGGTDDDGEGEAEFSVMRKNLKSFFDIIYNIDSQLFTTYVHFAVLNTLANYEKAGNSFDWRDLELALHVLLLYGEAIKGQLQFMKTENEIVILTPLGEMVQKMVQCNVATYSHPLIILNFFENVVRYYQFFEVQPEYIPSVLEVFVDSRGLHSHDSQIRSRSWYLFYRFIKLLKSNIDKYVETVLRSIQDLLIIQAVVPRVDSPDESPLTKDKALEAGFSEQLYILETVGILITIETIKDRQLEFTKAVFNPLLTELQSYLNTKLSEPVDVHTVLQLHHLIMAIGSIAKGFPEAPKRSAPTAPWVVILKQATEAILVTLKTLDCYEIIRDASRYSFARLVNVLGIEILPYLPTLINGLLNKSEASELVDVLPFIGLISHKFNPSIFDILNELIVPLVNKVFVFFHQPPSGTDDVLLLVNLRKAYLNFILSLLNGGMDAVFISELNRPRLESILQSVIHYASDLSDIPTTRLSFNILSKTLTLWGEQLQSSGLYEHILRICFEVPMKSSFDANDGQSQLVLNEISNILKIILSQKGDDFVKYLGTFLALWSPPYDLDSFLQTLQQPDIKMFRKYFQRFIQRSKS